MSAKKGLPPRGATATPSSSSKMGMDQYRPDSMINTAVQSTAPSATPLTEKDRNSSGSDFSDVTECTGVTQVREIDRTSSATMQKSEMGLR